MERKTDLSIVILNYNTLDLLKQCLQSIADAQKGQYKVEIMVVDNCSSDESTSMVKKDFPWIKLVVNERNLGFAAGNNRGIERTDGRYVLLLNPDTQVLPETLVVMVKFLDDHPKVGIATGRVELVNGDLDDACHRGFPTPWNAFCHFMGLGKIFPKSRFFNGYHLGYRELDRTHEIDSCVGAFMMIRRKVGEALSWLDEDYFWYGEDLDFCYRAKNAGWKVMFVPTAKVIHWKGAASGIKKESQQVSTATQETKRKAALASIEAMRIFYRKHYTNRYPSFLTGLVLLGIDLLEKIRLSRV